jgi:hypothetical protein
MDYEFTFISTDNYELRYTSKDGVRKVLPFKRTIGMSKKLQGIQATGRLKMYQELTAQGMTKNDLVVKKVADDGSITYDETNYKEFETNYINIASALILNEVIEECFHTSVALLLQDLGVDVNASDNGTLNKITLFTKKFTSVIIGKDDPQSQSPSIGNQEQVPGNTPTI